MQPYTYPHISYLHQPPCDSSILADFSEKAPKAIQCLEGGFDDATAVMALPASYRKRLHSTNILERLNQEVRRQERVIRIFPNKESAMRLLGAVGFRR